MIIIRDYNERYAVLIKTFTSTEGMQPCEIWKEQNGHTYAIGCLHCPPVHSEFVCIGHVDFDLFMPTRAAHQEQVKAALKALTH